MISDEQSNDQRQQEKQKKRRYYLRELRETHNVQQKTIVARTKEDKGNVSKYCNGSLPIGETFWRKLKEAFKQEFAEIEKKEKVRAKKRKISESTNTIATSLVSEPDASYTRIIEGVKKENQTLRKAFETQMTSLNDQLTADRTVILQSLARLEGKPADQLLKEAAQRKQEIEKAREKPD